MPGNVSAFRSTLRFLATGVMPTGDRTDADGALDAKGTPPHEITTALWTDIPWLEGLEDVHAQTGLFSSPDPNIPDVAVGASPIIGAYEGAVRTEGPASYWPGHEVSGGPFGDQAIGRRMLFKIPLVMATPDAGFEGAVTDAHWADELAASVAHNGQGQITDAEVTQHLLLWEGDTGE